MIVAIIQARMSSTRLPEKVLVDIAGRPMLWHVVSRTRSARLIDRVVVATTTNPADDPVAVFCRQHDIDCFRGSEEDVLDRFYQAAKKYDADPVVRVTGDCPMIDPEIFDKVIAKYLEGGYDYATNVLELTYPDGLDLEMFSFAALERAWRETTEPRYREHVGSFIRYSGLFSIANVENDVDLLGEDHRWTVDDERDLEFVREVFARLSPTGDGIFGMNEVLSLLARHSEILSINQGTTRNEGAYLSFANGPAVPPRQLELSRSNELATKARSVLSQSMGSARGTPAGSGPAFLARGEGSHVWDLDGNEYVDYDMANGQVILGHNYPAVTEAVVRQTRDGATLSLSHPLVVEVAEMLIGLIPSAEMVSLYRSEVDAASAAVDAALGHTGKSVIAYCIDEGQEVRKTPAGVNAGVKIGRQTATSSFDFNDIAGLERIFAENLGRVAAVVMKPIQIAEPRDGFLKKVRRAAEREGALLVFDETATLFRVAEGGAQQYFGVIPDLTYAGSAIANGYPIGLLAGRREIMSNPDGIGQFGAQSDAVSLAAARATIAEVRDNRVVRHLWATGRRLKDGCTVLAREFGMAGNIEIAGLPPQTKLRFTGGQGAALSRSFHEECLIRGLLGSDTLHVSYQHANADIDQTLRVYRSVIEICGNIDKSK